MPLMNYCGHQGNNNGKLDHSWHQLMLLETANLLLKALGGMFVSYKSHIVSKSTLRSNVRYH